MPTPRFLTLDDVAEILAVSWSQAYALVRRKELLAIQIGGRGQWRVEVAELERFIQRKYEEARAGTVPPEPGAGSAGDPDTGGSSGATDHDSTGDTTDAAADDTGGESAAAAAGQPTPAPARRGRAASRRRAD
jgi:excisionase family DNA binding protein